jgi:3'(2'), 5'-bisphosphate nucleotidase
VVLGALACPRLDGSGVLLSAERDRGTRAASLFSDDEGALVRAASTTDLRFCESVESSHSDHALSARIAVKLGITAQPLRLDSQAKYACVARGDASIYLRLPTRADYREKIWDHAAGAIVVEEAGGRVSDVRGAALDFSRGRQLEDNAGVIATSSSEAHARVVEAVGEALAH